jgi:hypothetical protein
MLTSRERVALTLNHQIPDRVPLDLGGGPTTGMHVSSIYLLRQAFKLDSPGTPVKVIEPYQMLGEIKPDLMEVLGVDVVGVSPSSTLFGFKNEGWKDWTLFDGTPVLVPAAFNTEPEPDGSILMYPEGDRSAPASGHMPKNGFYFDTIVRQPPFDEDQLNPENNLEEFGYISDEELAYFQQEVERLYTQTDKAILVNFGGTALGDIALVPAPWLKYPKGIRDIAEWYISLAARPDYIYQIFEKQCQIALANLEKLYPVLGDRVTAVYISGTDFGTQNGPFMSNATFRQLYTPFYQQINGWIHQHTPWKTFMHSCGSIISLLPDMIEAGFDIYNPVQCSAAGMEPRGLKARFGQQLIFWGGGVDTQRTLPFGSPAEIRAEVRERMRIFGANSGFVFNTTHNVQPNIPVENLLAMYETVQEYRNY